MRSLLPAVHRGIGRSPPIFSIVVAPEPFAQDAAKAGAGLPKPAQHQLGIYLCHRYRAVRDPRFPNVGRATR